MTASGTFIAVRPRSAALAAHVAVMWYQRLDESATQRERVIPTGTAGLHINIGESGVNATKSDGSNIGVAGAAVQGPMSRPQVISTHQLRHSVGVGFHPGGLYPFVGSAVAELAENLVPARQLWGDDVLRLIDRLTVDDPYAAFQHVEEALLAWQRRNLWRGLPTVVEQLANNVAVATLGDAYGWTGNRLRRTFTEQVGLTPKLYGRLGRFQRMLARAAAGPIDDWGRLAIEHGYSDQSHLIHEFHRFADVSPGRYRPVKASARNHIGLEHES